MAASLRRVARLTAAFSIAGFKAKDQRSALGFLWSLLNPLLLATTLFVVFHRSLGAGRPGPDYFLDVLIGSVVWNFFVTATTVGASSLVVRAEFIKNVAFPLDVPVYGDVGALALQLLLELAALLGCALALGARPSLTLLLLPLVIAGLLLLVTGISLVLACLCLVARDLQHIWSALTRVLFFATPVFYPVELLPAPLRPILSWNPIGAAMEALRTLCRGGLPGSSALLANVLGGALVFLLGALIFRGTAPVVVEKA